MLNRIEEKEKYSNFFNSLIKRRHALFFKSASDESTVLESHGKSLYNNVIIFNRWWIYDDGDSDR